MISVAWLLYALGLSALAGAAALAAEAVLRSRDRPVRWVWLAAVTASVAAPLAVAVVVASRPAVPTVSGAAPVVVAGSAASASGAAAVSSTGDAVGSGGRSDRLAAVLRREVDAIALPLWAAASALVVLFGLAGWVGTRLRRRRWRARRLHGVSVDVSPSDGPAAVGVFRGRIVVPRWTLALPRRMTRLILLHEGEHVRRGDTALLGCAGALLVAMPWNPLVWWQCRRLTLAIELDCDRRVIARCRDRRGYAGVLVEMAARGRRRPALSPALGPGALERRVRALIDRRPGSRARVAVGTALAVAAVAVACETPIPSSPLSAVEGGEADGAGGRPTATATSARRVVVHDSPRLGDRAPLRDRLRRVAADPAVRDLRGSVVLTVHVDAEGRPTRANPEVTVARSGGGEEMVGQAIAIAMAARLEPAVRDGRPVASTLPLWVVFGEAGVEASLVDPVERYGDADGPLDVADRWPADLELIREMRRVEALAETNSGGPPTNPEAR